MRRRGFARQAARAAFIRKRAPNSDDAPTCRARALRVVGRQVTQNGMAANRGLAIAHDAVVARAPEARTSPPSRRPLLGACSQPFADATSPAPFPRARLPNGAWMTTRTEFILVAELLDDERPLVRYDPRRDALLMQVVDERRCCRLIGVARGERRDLLRRSRCVELAAHPPIRARGATSAPRTRRARGQRRRTGRGGNDHLIVLVLTRHVDEPSWNTSPTRVSCTNSSSSSPSRVRSGRLTA